MSNPESFIDEVTEEVRRDKLFGYLRRYGWIGIVAVLLIVGGAAWNEYQKAQNQAESQAFGDAILTALDQDDAAARETALAAVPAPGQRAGILGLLLSTDPVSDRAAALTALEAVAADQSLPVSYRDLAILRRVIVAGADLSVVGPSRVARPDRGTRSAVPHAGAGTDGAAVGRGRQRGRCDYRARATPPGSGGTSRLAQPRRADDCRLGRDACSAMMRAGMHGGARRV